MTLVQRHTYFLKDVIAKRVNSRQNFALVQN
jgi:hypothetical protein